MPTGSGPHGWVLAALALSLIGDVALLQSGAGKGFVLGLFSFFLAHLAYVAALASAGVNARMSGLAAVPLVVAGLVVVRWLWPKAKPKLRGPVVAYIGVISVMVATAVGHFTTGAAAGGWALAGAVSFYLSDLFVARERFVRAGFVNKALGLPLYFGAQMLWVWWLAARAL